VLVVLTNDDIEVDADSVGGFCAVDDEANPDAIGTAGGFAFPGPALVLDPDLALPLEDDALLMSTAPGAGLASGMLSSDAVDPERLCCPRCVRLGACLSEPCER